MNEREKLIALIKAGTDVAVNKSVKETLQIVKEKHSCNSASDKTVSITDVLADYLLANGVIVPPVKVGDTVYIENMPYIVIDICFDGKTYVGTRLDCDEENDCSKCPFEIKSALSDTVGCIGEEYKDFSPNDIGKRVFLTREEAEKALAERDDEK